MSILSVQCKKEHKAAIDVSGITETDALGNSTGGIDNTDWPKDNVWTNEETKLFETPTSSQLAGTAADGQCYKGHGDIRISR